MARRPGPGKKRLPAGAAGAFTFPGLPDIVHTMNDTLLFLGVIVAWFLVVRVLFPKLGIRG